MPKIRRVKRRQKYRYNVNRKRLNNKDKVMTTINCKEIKNAWEFKKSLKQNLSEMGLVYDTNKSLKIPTTQEKFKPQEKIDTEIVNKIERPKHSIVLSLEERANAPRKRMFRLPQAQVDQITYLMDKYGEDYKAMALDKKNYYQETWKQIRGKIKKFKSIPEQYQVYLNNKQS